MTDSNKLQTKLALQKTRNMMSEIKGIQILDYEEYSLSDEFLQKSGYCSNDKIADARIPFCTDDEEIINIVCSLMEIKEEQILHLLVNGLLVKFQINDIRTAIHDIWDKTSPDSKGFVLINENKDTMYDLGSDSRDEDNYLFDIYSLL